MYEVSDGICRKYRNKVLVDSFKPYVVKAVPTTVETMEQIYVLPESEPEIGKRLYMANRDAWWLSTPVVRITKPRKRKDT